MYQTRLKIEIESRRKISCDACFLSFVRLHNIFGKSLYGEIFMEETHISRYKDFLHVNLSLSSK